MNTTAEPTEKWPRHIRVPFFKWFDAARNAARIKNDYELAKLAGINHSSISAWRAGRQRPSTASLADVARPLGVSSREIWDRAGLLNERDRAEMMTQAERAGVDLIQQAAGLTQAQKTQLKAMFLEQERRDRAESLRRLQEQIDLVTSGPGDGNSEDDDDR